MKKLLLILLCVPLIGFTQSNFNVTINNGDAWNGNFFIHYWALQWAPKEQ